MLSKGTTWIIAITLSTVFHLTYVVGQTQISEKSTRKKFGSSLSRPQTASDQKAGVSAGTENNEPALDDGDIVRINTRLVVFDVRVVGPNGVVVTGLTKNDFVLTQEKQSLPITTFDLGDDAARRRSIILIIDRSTSQLPYIKTSSEAAKMLVERLGPLDQMAIVTDDIKLVQDFTTDRSKLNSALDSLRMKVAVGARQYSTLMATLRELVRQDERTIIIFQTDGDQLWLLKSSEPNPVHSGPPMPRADFSLGDVYTEAEKSRATVYSIISGFRLIGLSPAEQLAQLKKDTAAKLNSNENGPITFWKWILSLDMSDASAPSLIDGPIRVQLAMAGIAKLTGGHTEFLETPGDAVDIYRRILDDANGRYLLGFQPPDVGNGNQRRTVGIEVRGHPEYSVLGRKSYYSTSK